MSETKEIYLKNYEKPAFSIQNVNLVFELYEEFATVTNLMSMTKLNHKRKIFVSIV